MYRVGELINKQFEVRRCLAGGMGYVYVAFDQVTETTLAIKTLKDELVRDQDAMLRFEQEAHSWVNLKDHENIVRAIAFHRGSEPLLLLEYIDGCNLHELLRGEPSGLAFSQALRYATQIAHGMHHTHHCPMPRGKHGVIHRDLKPSNVMIDRDNVTKVTDFGLAKCRETSSLSDSGRIMGTLPYMPPEQYESYRAVKETADIYSFGGVVYAMVTANVPFSPGSLAEMMHRVLHTDPEPIETYRQNTPQRLIDLIMWCLRKEPEERPQSMEQVLVELDRLKPVIHDSRRSRKACRRCGYLGNKQQLRCLVCRQPCAKPTASTIIQYCNCGAAICDGHRFCMECGTPAPTKLVCPACSEENPTAHRFCCSCGKRLVGDDSSAVP
jgi:serine/threonine protein kinase